MAVFIPGNPPQYLLTSDEIASGSFVTSGSVSYIGAIAFDINTGNHYRVSARNTLSRVPQEIGFMPDLVSDASNVKIVLANYIGTVAVPDTARRLGFYTSSSTVRIGFEAPAVLSGSATGSAVVLSDWKLGMPLQKETWNWFTVGYGSSRTLYFRSGSPSDTIEIVQT